MLEIPRRHVCGGTNAVVLTVYVSAANLDAADRSAPTERGSPFPNPTIRHLGPAFEDNLLATSAMGMLDALLDAQLRAVAVVRDSCLRVRGGTQIDIVQHTPPRPRQSRTLALSWSAHPPAVYINFSF